MRRILMAAITSTFGTVAAGAQLYVQPVASVSAEYDSNLDFDTSDQVGNEGYILDAATLFGIATRTSDINLRPRIRYDEYPSETSLNRLEGMLDFNSQISTQRSSFYVFGRFDHLNENEAELPGALYNDVSPQAPTSPQTGQANLGVTRDNVYLAPKYSFDVARLTSIGASGVVENLTYSETNRFNRVDFNYEQAELFLDQTISPRANITFGGYGTRYHATTIDSNAQSGGATVDYDYKWTSLVHGEISVQYQHTTIDAVQPTIFHGAANTLGATLSGVWQQQTGVFRFNLGRQVTPSGGGGLYVDDQLQGEYDKSLTERLDGVGALLFVHSRGLSANISTFDQNYGQLNLSLKWMLTRTWFLQGGGSYTTLKYSIDPTGAANAQAYLQFGYQGLPRQQ